MKIAILGPPESFSEEALYKFLKKHPKKYCKGDIEIVYTKSFEEATKLVSNKKVEGSLIPVETTYGGSITEAWDAIIKNNVYIVGEIEIDPQFFMFAKEKNAKLMSVGSHPQAFIASEKFLEKNYPCLERIETNSTSEAAQMASKDPALAAICSKRAGQINNLQELHKIPVEKFKQPKNSIVVYAGNPKKLQEIYLLKKDEIKNYPKIAEELLRKHNGENEAVDLKFNFE
ncbi:MAG: prephenate dehydratase domain-containing protein [Candidatus Aenigmatarchaeota archaeon]